MPETIELCPEIPGVGDGLKITLPFGGEMQAIRDFTAGIPDDCSMSFSLLLQLPPLLGGIGCILKMLDALSALQGFVSDPLNPNSAFDALEKLGELSKCFPPLIFTNLICMVRDILLLIIKLLTCLIQFLESIFTFNASIDLDTAQGNPALLEVLNCAKDNSQLTLEHLLAALEPIETIFSLLEPILGFVPDLASLEIEFPSVQDIVPGADLTEMTEPLKDIVNALQQIVDVLPC